MEKLQSSKVEGDSVRGNSVTLRETVWCPYRRCMAMPVGCHDNVVKCLELGILNVTARLIFAFVYIPMSAVCRRIYDT